MTTSATNRARHRWARRNWNDLLDGTETLERLDEIIDALEVFGLLPPPHLWTVSDAGDWTRTSEPAANGAPSVVIV